jgi:hypothetical protein
MCLGLPTVASAVISGISSGQNALCPASQSAQNDPIRASAEMQKNSEHR